MRYLSIEEVKTFNKSIVSNLLNALTKEERIEFINRMWNGESYIVNAKTYIRENSLNGTDEIAVNAVYALAKGFKYVAQFNGGEQYGFYRDENEDELDKFFNDEMYIFMEYNGLINDEENIPFANITDEDADFLIYIFEKGLNNLMNK